MNPAMGGKTLTVKEYEPLPDDLAGSELQDLEEFACENKTDERGNSRLVLKWENGKLRAQNYVGIIQTRKGTVLEILPKVDFGKSKGTEEKENIEERTRKIFFKMLRTYRRLKNVAQFNEANIRDMRNFNMLEIFFYLFLNNLVSLTQRGLARGYQPQENNLPCLRGRILFTPHIRENSANRARFYVGYDEFTANRPVNRLIHSALHKLISLTREPRNQQLLHQLRLCFADIPESKRIDADWERRRVDRSMSHYDRVMPWVGLFLFGHGLTTFAGKHVNASLLFPMEEVFEDFVTHAFKHYQNTYPVRAQSPQRFLAKKIVGEGKEVFQMEPDISLMDPDPSLRDRKDKDKVKFILDAKWKSLNEGKNDSKHGIIQTDMYQLYSYGAQYSCKTVALIYPKTKDFTSPLEYKFGPDFDNASLKLFCFPFDVEKPEESVKEIVEKMESNGNRAQAGGQTP